MGDRAIIPTELLRNIPVRHCRVKLLYRRQVGYFESRQLSYIYIYLYIYLHTYAAVSL